MAVDVDTLQIQIEAESTDAAAKVNALADSLERLQGVIEKGKFSSIVSKIKGVGSSASSASSSQTRQRQQILDSARQTVDAGAGQQMESTAEKAGILKNALSSIKSAASSAGSALQKFGSGIASLSSSDLSKLGSGLKSFGSFVVSGITKPFTDAIRVVSKWKNSLGRIAFYRAIRTAIAAVTSSLKEGINNLYQYSRLVGTEFAPAMNSLATSALYLKNSFGAMAAPLIQAVAPAVDYLVDKFVDLLNIIGKVFAALTGKSTYTQAKKYATEYAEAANDAAAATQKFLLGIDELNIIDTPSSSGADALDYGSMFEEVEVPTDTMDWAAQIRQAIEDGDWYSAGAILADKLNSVVDGWDSYAWGASLGEKINNGLNAAYGFMSTFDFGNLGSKVASGLNGIFDTVDWDLLGRTFASKWNALTDGIYGFVTTFDWSKFGLSISDAVNGWFDEIDWKKAAQTVSLGVKGLLTSMITFLEETNWYQVGRSIGEFIINIDWLGILGGAATVIADALIAVFKMAFGLAAEGLTGNGEGILGNALSIAAGAAVALVTVSYLTSLLKTIGTKLSALSKTKKMLASAVLVAIEFSVSEWSITEFLSEGDFKNILINLLSTGVSSYLLYKTLGPKGLILGVAVGVVANIVGLTTELASGLSWNDPKALITEALTIALGGIGGAIGLSKIGFTAGEGLVISLSVTAALTLTSINFSSIASGQYDSGSAQSVIMSALSTLFAGAGGAALATALGVATGGVGFVVGISVGLIVNIVSAEIAEQQNIKNIVFDAFMESNDGQFTLTDIEVSFEGLAETVSKSFASIAESGKTVESVRTNLSDTVASVNTLVNEVAIGAVSIDENIDAILDSFEQLKDDSSQIFEEERRIIIEGLAGSIGEVASALGVDIPAVTELVNSLADAGIEYANSLTTEMSELLKALDEGLISQEEFETALSEVMSNYQELMGTSKNAADGFAESVDNWKNSMNFSDIVDGTSVNTSALADILFGFEASYTSSVDSINEGTDTFRMALEDYIRIAESTGRELSNTEWENLANTLLGAESDRAAQIETMKGYYGEVLDAVQNDLVGGLEDEVKRLEDEYESTSPVYKFFHSEDSYVQQGLKTYQSDVVDPILAEIEASMERIGLEGEPWAEDAMEAIIDALFSSDIYREGSEVAVLTDDVSGAIKGALEDVSTRTVPVATETGENIAAGILEGNESYLNEHKSFFENIIEKLPEWAKNILGIHSPSTVFAEIGGFMTEGLLNGISGTWGTITEFFSEKTSSLKEDLSATWDSIKETASAKWSSIKTSLGADLDSLKATAGTKFESIKTSIGEVWNSTKSDSSTKWDSIKTTLSGAWDDVKSTASTKFTAVKTEISNIFSGIKTSAKTWGSDICSNLASGISGAISTVTSAVKNVANKISSYLHFSEPDIGPLSNFHTYMPDMLELMAKGIKENEYLAVDAVSDLASSVASTFNDIGATELQFPVHEDAYVHYGADFAGSQSRMTGSGDDSEGFVAGIKNANEEMISVIYAVAQQIVTAVNNSGGDTYLDGVKVASRATSIQNRQNRMYGKTLQNA